MNLKEEIGIGLSAEDIKSGKVLYTVYKPFLKYKWSAGVAISRFLNELKNGRIIGRKCKKCNRILVPPRMFCELCYRNTDEWVYVKDTGRINTYSVAYISADASRRKEPLIPAVIEIDGASKGMGILHLIGETKIDDLKIGLKVKAVWKPESEREGAITDIKYFKAYGD
jgi:hypothetical protein